MLTAAPSSAAPANLAAAAARAATTAVSTSSGAAAKAATSSTSAVETVASCANPIACENQLPGTPQSVWDMSSSQGSTIQGYADPFSVNAGSSINFKVQTSASSYVINIYRIGYYGGDGARLVTTISSPNISVSNNQPACNTNTVTGLVDCGNWGVSATWNVPSTAVSGVYIADLVRTDGTSDMNQIPFVVTNSASTSDVVMMTNDETWQAYNDWGGYSLYTGDTTGSPWCCSAVEPGRAVQVSYNRPFHTRYASDDPNGRTYFFSDEFPMIEFLEQNGYNVSYVSQEDVGAANGATMLEQHKVLLEAGHSEYWDPADRANVTAARNAGVSLAFFSGNNLWWETRWANSQFNNEANRTLVSYKESLDSAATDPADPPSWTGNWRDPRFSPPASGGQPENALTGQLWMVDCCSYPIQVPYADSKLSFWANTAVAKLQPGQSYTSANELLGYEWDMDIDNGFRPAGEIDMSSTTQNVQELLNGPASTVTTGNVTHSLTLYRASSGALVFDAGTVQWAWGLNSDHDGDSNNPPDPAIQQATVNLLSMMGAQPATIMSGLLAGPTPHDTSPPSSTITSPSAGASIASGSTVTVTGTATDSGGGVVAGVEVSTDGGTTWHRVTTMSAAGTSVTWSYTWSAAGTGNVTIKSRATDDDGNIETPGSGVTVTVNCPCSLFSANYVPSVTSANDTSSNELGIKFQSSVSGWVQGVRFYKGSGNGGSHTGSLWSASGTLMATGTFTNETATGWQTLLFTNPVQISANTTYVASYYDPQGHYAIDQDLLDWPLSTPPLTAPKSNYAVAGGGNGVYNPGGPGFPTVSFAGSSYAVDVIFSTTQTSGAPPAVVSTSPFGGSSSNALTTAPSVTFSKQVVPSTVHFTLTGPGNSSVAGTTSMDSTDEIATFTPSSQLAANTTYTANVTGAQDSSGQTMTAYSFTFTTSKNFDVGGQCPCTIWPDATPSNATNPGDNSQVEVGVQFQPSVNGQITGVRFYKVAANSGTHTGSLWTASGTLLATGTFSNESTTGWEELDFSSPVSVTAGTTYVASYHTNAGNYAFTANGLASPVTNGPLTALANGGVYTYGSSTVFPTSTFESSNFWVDVVFSATATPPAVTSTTPANGQTGVATNSTVSFTFNQAVQPSTVHFTLTSSGGTVAGTTTMNSADTIGTFTPTSALSAGTTYTATVSGAQNGSGTAMSGPFTWSFTTAPASGSGCPCTIWPSTAQPAVAAANDPSANNIGVKFSSSQSGYITGVRFYKGSTNTGTHIGYLWTSGGSLLAQVTFTNETASGWQQANFSTPVAITAGTTYEASYSDPNGDYSYTYSGLASAVTNGPLTALANGGVYAYGSAGTFPTSTYQSSNFWVDVVFTAAPIVSSTTPLNGQTGVPTSSTVSFTFSQAVQPSTVKFTLTSSGGSVAGTTTMNSADTIGTFTPTSALAAGTTYTATVSGAQNSSGTAMSGPFTWTFTTASTTGSGCPCTIWPGSAQPAVAAANDPSSNNIGVKFTTSQSGFVTGIRFYKGSTNTGTHVGYLWSSTGSLLGQVTFTGETASGWQQANFSTPIAVTAGTTYVASYSDPNGNYAYTYNGLSSAVTNGPLTALLNGGVYAYGSAGTFPTSTYQNSNFWVDVVFNTTS